jgi:TRAP-type C4-dicarboxylate transport system substrate-binding protein
MNSQSDAKVVGKKRRRIMRAPLVDGIVGRLGSVLAGTLATAPVAAFVVMVAGSAIFAAPAVAQTKHEWKFASIIPAGQDAFIDRFKELGPEISRRTNGQVQISFFPAGEMPYKAPEHLRVTGKGLLEMSEIVSSMAYGDAPALLLGDLPFIALNPAEQQTVRKVVWPDIEAALRKQGVEPIAYGAYPPRNIFTRSPAKSLGDLKGRKIRTAGGFEAEYLKVWGISPSFVVWAEVYLATQRGVVDGLLTAAVAVETAKLYEVAPYLVKIDGPVASFHLSVNQAAWKKLTPELQKSVKEVGEWWSDRWQKMVVEDADNGAIKRMVDKGQLKSVVQVPPAVHVETRTALIPVYRSYVKDTVGPQGSATLEKVLTELKLQ